jgi:DNA-binding HxlR family transcriptional regulator
VKEIIAKLNKQFENRIRLGIMSVLMVNETMDFINLRELLDVTDGNLASHLNALEKYLLIEVRKKFVGKKPNTAYRVTPAGRLAFKEHMELLEKLVKNNTTKNQVK